MYRISILVPIFNVENYIERCARSLFEQTYPDLEFVFVNDCSPDRSVEVLQSVVEKYPDRAGSVKIINHDTNRGVAVARNTLLDNATGDFVSWVDSDDWLEHNAMELLIQKQIETDADLVSGNVHIFHDHEVESLTENEVYDKGQLIMDQLKDTWNMNTFIWGRLFRRSLFEDYHIRGMEGCNYAEDRYLVIRFVYFARSFATLNGFVYNYDKRNEYSITVQQRDNMSVYLRNQYQHLQNWIGIRDFFADKEFAYYKLAVKHSSYLLKLNLDWALKYKTKKDFFDVVALIDENEDCMSELGWVKNGIKGACLHSYYCMWTCQLLRRLQRLVIRKMHLEKEA